MSAEVVAKRKRKSGKRYKISHEALLKMALSNEAKQEMILKGIAAPSPNSQRLKLVPEKVRSQVEEALNLIESINEAAGKPVCRLTILKRGK